jgi:CXXX repeat radical SAM target protein
MKRNTDMSKKNETASKMDRRGFLKSGAKVIPTLAILGFGLAAVSTPARADCFGSCKASCADNCVESCKGDCMGDCKGTCGGCDNTCTSNSR